MSTDLLARLITAGTPADLVAEVAMALAEAKSDAAAIQRRRDRDADRQAAKRARDRADAASRNVTAANVTSRDSADVSSPAPSPLSSPQTPQQTPHPHPHPVGFDAYTRGLAMRAVLAAIEAGCAAAIAASRKPDKPRWPRTMPPPPGVSDDQWAGFIAHRKAKRSALTDHAYRLLTKKLDQHASDEWPPGRLVDTMIERGWISFEPEWLTRQENRYGRSGSNGHQPRRGTGNGLLDAVFDAECASRAGAGV